MGKIFTAFFAPHFKQAQVDGGMEYYLLVEDVPEAAKWLLAILKESGKAYEEFDDLEKHAEAALRDFNANSQL